MPVQVTPFQGTNIRDIALQGQRELNTQRQLAQRDRSLDQVDRRQDVAVDQMEQRLQLATQELNMTREQVLQEALGSAIDQSSSREEVLARLDAIGFVPTEDHKRNILNLPDEVFDANTQGRELSQAKLENEQAKTDNAEARLQIDRDRLELDRQKAAQPSVTEQLKLDQAARSDEKKGATKNEIASLAQGLLGNPDIQAVFGSIEGRLPSIFQSTADAEGDVDRLVALLSLEAREALKGTGQISDFESKQLGAAATKLSNKSISDEAAREELERIAEIFGGVADRDRAKGTQVGRFTVRAK